ncbi:MAG TPA: hypothetical protein VHC67_07395 [Gaiellaceae bacterium]|nr:hypothetical protein [Gaiellaceae bacterium]
MTLHSVRGQALYVAPIRIGLGIVWYLLARLAGLGQASALLAAGGSVFVVVFVWFNDPRTAFRLDRAPAPAPPDAVYAGRLRQALAATVPSTVGVSVLAAAALAWKPALTAVLGGISAGLGVAGLLHALRADPTLWFDRRGKGVYRRP